jgi:hypothetical protein
LAEAVGMMAQVDVDSVGHANETQNSGVLDDEELEDLDSSVPNTPLKRLSTGGANDHATFSLRHGLQDVDPASVTTLAKVGIFVAAAAAVWAVRRLFLRERMDVANSWAWSSGETMSRTDQIDLSKPLMGTSFAVAEKCVLLRRNAAFAQVGGM